MSTRVILFLSVFLLVYSTGHYYIGLRCWQLLGAVFPLLSIRLYWLLFLLLAVSPLIGRFGGLYFSGKISSRINLVGAYWMAAAYYFFLLFLLVDGVCWGAAMLGLIPTRLLGVAAVVSGVAVFGLVSGLLFYGSWNARHPQIKYYDLSIAKAAGDLAELHIVMVSDIHLGSIVGNQRLEGLVSTINQLNPDVVLFAGDIIDENVNHFVEQKMPDTFRKLKPRFGSYAIFGNHEYIGGHAEQAVELLTAAKVTVLRDSYVNVDGRFSIVGRDDLTHQRMSGQPRKELAVIMEGIDRSLPVIMMDHQPFHLEEGQQQGVDLQVSGHTHRGQLFPNNWITQRVFEVDWGYLRKGNYQVIVSSGFGTWGPPIRIGNTPEVVDIKLHFIPATC
jgi:hypothetical protein